MYGKLTSNLHCPSFDINSVTPLYHLEPMNIHTHYSESLISYIGRLACAHCVFTGDLLGRYLAPKMGKDYLFACSQYGGSRFYESSAAILGVGKEANDWATILNECTGYKILHCLTMYSWRGLIPSRRLIRARRAWCPQCFIEMTGSVVYEPLLWALQVVESCPYHMLPLVMVCPYCKKDNYQINRRYIPGYCNRCGKWLGSNNKMQPLDIEPDYNIDLSMLFNCTKFEQTMDIRLYKQLEDLMIFVSQGSVSSFAKILNKPKSTVWEWIRGSRNPSLIEQISICTKLNITLEQLYFGPIETIFVPDEIPFSLPREARRLGFRIDYDYQNVCNELERYAADAHTTKSIRTIAQEIGISERTLRKHYSELCCEINQKNKAHADMEKRNQLQDILSTILEVKSKLLMEGRYPSRRALEEEVGAPVFLNKRIREMWAAYSNKPIKRN